MNAFVFFREKQNARAQIEKAVGAGGVSFAGQVDRRVHLKRMVDRLYRSTSKYIFLCHCELCDTLASCGLIILPCSPRRF